MVIPKAIFLDPARNGPYVVAATALSTFVFAYSTRFGQVSILAFYLCWLPLLILSPGLLLKNWWTVVLVLVLPALAVASTAWSDRPHVTLRAGVQYASTVVSAVIAARVSTPRTLTLGGLVGALLVLAYSYQYGGYTYDFVDGSYAFAGAFASKNQFGLFASLGILFSVATLALFPAHVLWKLCALGGFVLSAAALAAADSATSTLTTLGTLVVLVMCAGLMRLSPSLRVAALGLGALVIIVAILFALQTEAFGDLLLVFGKDATLTGRTFLWREGIVAGNQTPILGLGYYAFWTPGRILAEELWDLFYISSRTGFHFHNTFIEVYVGLGILGVATLVVVQVTILLLTLRLLFSGRKSEASLFIALALLFFVRSAVEIDFLTPYTVGGFLIYYVFQRSMDQASRVKQMPGAMSVRRNHGGTGKLRYAGQ